MAGQCANTKRRDAGPSPCYFPCITEPTKDCTKSNPMPRSKPAVIYRSIPAQFSLNSQSLGQSSLYFASVQENLGCVQGFECDRSEGEECMEDERILNCYGDNMDDGRAEGEERSSYSPGKEGIVDVMSPFAMSIIKRSKSEVRCAHEFISRAIMYSGSGSSEVPTQKQIQSKGMTTTKQQKARNFLKAIGAVTVSSRTELARPFPTLGDLRDFLGRFLS